MRNLPVRLRVVILDMDIASAGALKAIIETKPDIEAVKVFSQPKEANDAFRYDAFNSLFIDIFTVGVEAGLDFIEHVRTEYPLVSICLYSHSSSLLLMPGVSDYWRNRFGHYFKLAKDKAIPTLDREVEDTLEGIAYDVQAEIARGKVTNLRKIAESAEPEQKREIEETANAFEKVLESKADTQAKLYPVPGMDTGQMGQLVNSTLAEAEKSLQVTTNVNIGVLIAGSLLVIVSFVVASITNRWEAVAFGGFGMAGIIASLITNPLKSIGLSARRLVQVQVAYLPRFRPN